MDKKRKAELLKKVIDSFWKLTPIFTPAQLSENEVTLEECRELVDDIAFTLENQGLAYNGDYFFGLSYPQVDRSKWPGNIEEGDLVYEPFTGGATFYKVKGIRGDFVGLIGKDGSGDERELIMTMDMIRARMAPYELDDSVEK